MSERRRYGRYTRGQRIPGFSLGIFVVLGMIVVAVGVGRLQKMHLVGVQKLPGQSDLSAAHRIHAQLAPLMKSDPLTQKEKVLTRALELYRAAKSSETTPLGRAEAAFGEGQMLLLGGETAAAVATWRAVADAAPDSFQALRAMKAVADTLRENGDLAAAAEWNARILREFPEGEMTQQTAIIKKSAGR